MATVTGKREVEVDGRRRSALPLAVLCDGDFVRSAEDCLCGLFKVVRNGKRLLENYSAESGLWGFGTGGARLFDSDSERLSY